MDRRNLRSLPYCYQVNKSNRQTNMVKYSQARNSGKSGDEMNARWDLFLPMLLVVAYSAAIWGLGYYEGKRNAELRHEKMANLRRRVAAREKQLYDWERDGI